MVCSRAVRAAGGIQRWGLVAGVAASLGAAGCGGQPRQDANEPSRTYPLEVTRASFPTAQKVAQASVMTVSVRNAGKQVVPDVAVTVETAGSGTGAQAFSVVDSQPNLAERSRPVWIVDAGPVGDGKTERPGFQTGQPNTAYANTWALGSLAPGRTVTFMWRVTAVRAGRYTVQYAVAPGLDGRAKAQLVGSAPRSFTVNVSRAAPGVVIGQFRNSGAGRAPGGITRQLGGGNLRR